MVSKRKVAHLLVHILGLNNIFGKIRWSSLTWRTSKRLAAESRLCTLCLLIVISPEQKIKTFQKASSYLFMDEIYPSG